MIIYVYLYGKTWADHIVKLWQKNRKQTIDQIVDSVMNLEQGSKIQVLAPVVRGRKVSLKNY